MCSFGVPSYLRHCINEEPHCINSSLSAVSGFMNGSDLGSLSIVQILSTCLEVISLPRITAHAQGSCMTAKKDEISLGHSAYTNKTTNTTLRLRNAYNFGVRVF